MRRGIRPIEDDLIGLIELGRDGPPEALKREYMAG